MAFDLRPTEDVLPWPGGANVTFDLVPDLQCPLRTWCEYDIRLSIGLATPLTYVLYPEKLTLLNNRNGIATRTKERISALLGTGARRMCHAGRASQKDGVYDHEYQKENYVRTYRVSRKDGAYDRGHQKGKYDWTEA
ncbi:hypothetical protein Tco_1241196 [Tanacetum coccineum]